MSQQPQLRLLQEQKRRWQWPLDLASYDRAPLLSHAEQQALDQFVVLYEHVIPSPSQRLDLSEDALSRLLCPIRDVLTVTGADVRACNLAVWFLLRQMHRRRAAFWAWSNTEWIEILCPSGALFGHQYHVNGTYCRPYALAVAYLLCNYTPGMALGTVHYHSFAIKVFGKPLVEQAIKRVSDPLLQWGHGTDVVISLPNELSKLLVWNRSPQVEDLTYAFLDQIRQGEGTMGLKDWMPMVSRALVDLGILERPLPLKNEAPRFGKWIETADVAPVWVDYCNRWYATTTASLRTKKHMYYRILRIGRWVTAFHPEMASPLDWTREMAAECVAEISRMKVGEWINVTEIQVPKRGLDLQPRSKGALLAAMSAFFQDGQEWGWFPRRFDARRCFALPRAIKALIGPQPRVIQDDVWFIICTRTP